jgi:hypothetical protein
VVGIRFLADVWLLGLVFSRDFWVLILVEITWFYCGELWSFDGCKVVLMSQLF